MSEFKEPPPVHDETERRNIVKWLRSIPSATVEDWGLNAVQEIEDWLTADEGD